MPPREAHDNGVNEAGGNEPMGSEGPVAAGRTAPEGQSSTYFAAPLGLLRSGRLLFVSGASNVTIHADPSMEGLYRARLERQVTTVRLQGGTVRIDCPRLSSLNQRYLLDRAAEVALNASITWHIEIRGGASRLTADLREVRLCLLNLASGASRTEIRLPRPSATVSIRILGEPAT
jgi:hypothetical protein